MGRIGISYQDVVEAAFDIQNRGETPTIEKIRFYLGETGSNSTISKYLQVWRKQAAPDKNPPDKSPTPDAVHAAVESVWKQMREQSDTEIEKIKNETDQKIEAAQKQAIKAEEDRRLLTAQHRELQEAHHAVSAEKEILLLDLKKLREQHTLLQERYKSLDERYIDMHRMAEQQLKIASDSHQKEIARLEDMLHLQEEAHKKLGDEVRKNSEAERHHQMLLMDDLKIHHQKQDKKLLELQSQLRESGMMMAELEFELKSLIKERDEASNRLIDQEKKWHLLNDKTLIPDEIISRLYDMPSLETAIGHIDKKIKESINQGFTHFEECVKLLVKKTDTQDE